MDRVLLIAPLLALTLLGAHFYRAGALLPMFARAALALLLARPRSWVARLVQICLMVGTIVWIWTAVAAIQQRIALGGPWTRLALILGAVAVLTAASAAVFRHRRLRERFELN